MTRSPFRILIISAVLILAATNVYAEVWTWQRLPHVAAGGGWTSYLTISDPHGISDRWIYVYFYDDNGQPLTLNVDGTPQSEFNFSLSAYQEKVFVLTANTTGSVGQVQIASQGPGTINASLRFAYINGSGNIVDVVGVLPVVPNFQWSFGIDKRASTDDMGVVVANPWSTSGAMDITFDLYQNGIRVPGTASVTVSVAPLGHLARFVSQLFPNAVYSGLVTMEVSSSDNTFCAVALRADGSQYSTLSTNAEVQYWNVALAGVSGTETWGWRFNDGYTFLGYGTNPDNQTNAYVIRGVLASDLSPAYFLLEWNYSDSSDGSQGVMIYQGTPANEGGVNVINGTRISMKKDGTILDTKTFRATQLP